MAQKIKKIDWLNHSLEFFVVVVGILLAFQLDNFSEEKKREKTLETHRFYLAAETRLNKSSMIYAIDGAQNSLDKITKMLNTLQEPDFDSLIVNQIALELLRFDYAYIKRNAYSTLTESGDIRYMNFKEKTDTINLYEYYGWIQSVQITNASTHNNVYIAMVREHLDMSGTEVQPAQFYQSKVFKNALLSYQNGLKYKISKYQDCLNIIIQYMENNQITAQ